LIATTQTLWDNLQNLDLFAATVNGDIDKINSEFNQNYSQIIAREAPILAGNVGDMSVTRRQRVKKLPNLG
jgi:hypothetical protein